MFMQQVKKKIIQRTRKTLWRKTLCLVPVLRPRDRSTFELEQTSQRPLWSCPNKRLNNLLKVDEMKV